MLYKIPSENISELRLKVERIKKKCSALNCEFFYKELDTVYEAQVMNGISVRAEYVNVECFGKAMVSGFEFVAEIQHLGKSNIINNASNMKIPEKYRTSNCTCDHCNTNRVRNSTYLVYNTETSEFKQVGKSCLREYTNGLSVEHVAAILSSMKDISEQDYEFVGQGTKISANLEQYLYNVKVISDIKGYISKSDALTFNSNEKSKESITATYYDAMFTTITEPITDAQKQYVKDAIEWIKTLSASNIERSEYLSNLHSLFLNDYCEPRNLALACSLIQCYDREMLKQKQKEVSLSETEYFGNIGDKITQRVYVKLIASYYTQFGETSIYSMTMENSKAYFIWKTAKGFNDGEYIVSGTIKEHCEYNGKKQTVITRCKLSNI